MHGGFAQGKRKSFCISYLNPWIGFMFRFSRSPISYSLQVALTWRVGWGPKAKLEGADWQEGPLVISVSASRPIEGQLAFSPSLRYAVVGDIWLADRKSLLPKLASENLLHLSDVQLVAAQ
jgi:asparagine synthase (glutamine-hydrolysing)